MATAPMTAKIAKNSTRSTNGTHAGNGANGESKGVRACFRSFSQATATAVGSPWAFLLAVVIVIVWGVTGPMFHYSDTWQLVINTGTTIVTFLMVFLIQNTQNRDARAMHLKLDELIRSIKGARNHLVDLEELSDEELDQLQKEFARLRERTAHHRMEGAQEAAHELHEQVVGELKDRKHQNQSKSTAPGAV
jgi:low affinity Fe/Cu permease